MSSRPREIMTSAEPTAAEIFRFDDVVVERFPLGKHRTNAYVVYETRGNHAAIIDPGASGDILIERVTSLQLIVDAVLLTHAHWDHVGAVNEIACEANAPVYVHRNDRKLLRSAPIYAFRIDAIRFTIPANVLELEDGVGIPLGESQSISALHVPGHTEGGVAYHLGRALFTGDTLMPEEAGRFDLPGGDEAKLTESLALLRRTLDSDTMICPGHGSFWPSPEAAVWLANRLGISE